MDLREETLFSLYILPFDVVSFKLKRYLANCVCNVTLRFDSPGIPLFFVFLFPSQETK